MRSPAETRDRAAAHRRCLADIAEPTVLVAASACCEAVEEIFVARPDLWSVVLIHPEGALEMLTRRRFLREFNGRIGYGRALFARREVSALPGGDESLVLDGSMTLLDGGHAALARTGRERYDDIVVPTASGAATVSIARLFSELADLHAYRSLHDPLTGLANRKLFTERVRAAVAVPDTTAAVLFVDIDDFKAINDSLGHLAGDELLQIVGERLRDAFRGEDTVARLGGDEFAVLLDDATEHTAVAAAGRIALALTAPAAVGGRAVVARASVGVALEDDERGSDALLRNADLAMYAVKHAGKDGHALFAPAMHARAVERLELAQDLGGALDAGQLRLEYQPIVDLASGTVTGVEALLRWTHPRRGTVPPLEFIALAEQSGAIIPIGRWVLEEALRQVAAWSARRPGAPALIVGVNVSARQIEQPGYAEEVRAALAHSGVAPGALVLEITESALIRDDEATRAQFVALARLGVTIAIDDFGTGFSSLHRLQELPIGMLKIDKTFVDRLATPGSSGLIRGLLGLADGLGIQALAEGIETAHQLAELVGVGCRLGQGYHLSHPLHPDALGALLDAAAESAAAR